MTTLIGLLFSHHFYRIIIISGSGSDKSNALLNLTRPEPDIDKIAKDQFKC